MKAEIIAIGTELLLGQIVNTNAQFLAAECAAIGVDIYYQTVVGDNRNRLLEALRLASERADLILCTGGLGPTQDDLTKDVLAEYLGKGLMIDEASMDKITAAFAGRRVAMVESNTRQALILEDSKALPNDTGLAAGVAISQMGNHYMLLPGPPREMKPMFLAYGKSWISTLMHGEIPLYSKMLKFAGIGESSLEHQLIDLIEKQQDPTIAPYAREGEVTIRLTTRASDALEAENKLAPVEAIILQRIGNFLYAQEDIGIERVILDLLVDKAKTLAVAESCTGGLLSDILTSVPGSSAAFKGGLVCYSNDLKHRLLQVPAEILYGDAAPGAVSKETADYMATNLLDALQVDYSLSVTGVAGPDSIEGKPPGLVYIGLAVRGEATEVVQYRLSGNREVMKLRAAKQALYLLWLKMKQKM